MNEFIFRNEETRINDPVNSPTTAFVIVENQNGYMLLYNKYYNRWEITGGYIEPGESPIETAIRECKEESNQNIVEIKFFGIAKYSKMNAAIFYTYLSEEEAFIENEEIKELKWWKFGESITESVDSESIKLIELYRSKQ